MSESLKVGDRVAWNSSGERVTGRITKRLTEPTEIKGHHVAASNDNPEYLVVSDESGAEAAHHASALTRIDP